MMKLRKKVFVAILTPSKALAASSPPVAEKELLKPRKQANAQSATRKPEKVSKGDIDEIFGFK